MTNDWLDISKSVCTVSGAGGGIGRKIAIDFARQGAKVALLDLNIEAAETVAEEIRALGCEALAIKTDIADLASVEAARTAIEAKLGVSDVLVNNAAAIRNGALSSLSVEDWNLVLNVNLTGFFITSQVFGNAMMENGGGSIIHVASLAGSSPQPTSGAYSTSKAGVLMMSRNLAMEWGPKGVRSNVVSPAMVLTPLSEVVYADPKIKKLREESVPVRRIGMPQDISDAVVYLASPRSSYVTGQEILVDGGWSTTLLATVPRPGFDQE